jgi:hypothetical protein
MSENETWKRGRILQWSADFFVVCARRRGILFIYYVIKDFDSINDVCCLVDRSHGRDTCTK